MSFGLHFLGEVGGIGLPMIKKLGRLQAASEVFVASSSLSSKRHGIPYLTSILCTKEF